MSKFDPMNPLNNVTPRFTEEQLQHMVQWFDGKAKPLLVVDHEEATHAITVGQLQSFLALRIFHRRSFHYPDYAEIMREIALLGMDNVKLLNKDQFIYVLDKFVLEPDMKHELKLAFKMFDLEDRDFLELEELRTIITSYGDPLNPEETAEFMREANVRGLGNIYYNDFADDIFNLSPDLYTVVPKEYLYEDADQDPSVPLDMPAEAVLMQDRVVGPAPTPESEIPLSPNVEPELGLADLFIQKDDSAPPSLEPKLDQTTQIPPEKNTETKESAASLDELTEQHSPQTA